MKEKQCQYKAYRGTRSNEHTVAPDISGAVRIVCSDTLFYGSHALLLFTAAFAATGTLRCIAQAPNVKISKLSCFLYTERYMLQRVIAIITIVSLCLLTLMLVTTTPASAGPFGLLLIFITAYLTCLGLISFFLYGVSRVIVYASASFTMRRPLLPMSFRRSYYYSTVLAAAPVMLIGLQSVGAVTIYEFILVVIFEIIGCVYITKRIY